MTTRPPVDRLGAGRDVPTEPAPADVRVSLHELTTFDGAKVQGVLHTPPGARTVVVLAHPRQSVRHHPMVPLLLHMGVAVWTQDGRSPNNDLNLVHEQAVLDVAAGMVFLAERPFERTVTFGHSGGGTLMALYAEQAALEPARRLDATPAGRPVALAGAPMPVPDGAVFLAAHPGQGRVLLGCIDPSVTHEDDPLSADPALDMFSPANGFAGPPAPARYDAGFVAAYRTAQAERVARIDAVARARATDAAAARVRYASTKDPADRRAALAPRLITTYRTDADPRHTDLRLDANDRHYGSLFGSRPDLTNYGLVGFGRLTTPDAWLSTWSANTTNADFARCATGVHVPTMFVEFTGDAAAYPADSDQMYDALAAQDKTRRTVRGQHFGQPLAPGEPTGYHLAADELRPWLEARFPGPARA